MIKHNDPGQRFMVFVPIAIGNILLHKSEFFY